MTDEKKNIGFSGISSLASEVDEITLQAQHKLDQTSRREAESQRSESSGTPTTSVPRTAPSPSPSSKPEVVASGSSQVPRTGSSGAKWFWGLVGVGVLIWLLNAAQQEGERLRRDQAFTPTTQTPVIGSQPSPTRNLPLNRTQVLTEKEATGDVVRGSSATGQGLTQGDEAQSLNPRVPDDDLTASECGRWCDVSFWKTATVADLQADIAAGADVHARTEDGATPLHWAAALNVDEAMILVLVEAGADVHARTEDGVTPLHGAAALNANPDVITVLLKAGADLKAKDSSSKTPFDYIRENEKLKDWEAYWRLNYLQPQ